MGGGLYDEQGQLIGINTMTADKRVAEGIGFSIALPILIDLIPDRFHLQEQNPTGQQHEELAPQDDLSKARTSQDIEPKDKES